MEMGREYTLQEFIREFKGESVNYDILHFKDIFKKNDNTNIIMPSDSVLQKYENDLREALVTIRLTDQEVNLYRYNPKYLSFILYDTTEFWFLLLHANEMHYSAQFNTNPIKAYNESVIEIVNRIITLEDPYISMNRHHIELERIK